MRLRNISLDYLPSDIGTSINFSSIKRLHIIQCLGLPFLWKIFMDSRSGTHIEDFRLLMLDWDEYPSLHDEHGFEAFFASFGTSLFRVNVSKCKQLFWWKPCIRASGRTRERTEMNNTSAYVLLVHERQESYNLPS